MQRRMASHKRGHRHFRKSLSRCYIATIRSSEMSLRQVHCAWHGLYGTAIAPAGSRRNTPPYNIRFYHSAYRRVAPHAIAPMAEIRQKVCAALVLAQKLKRPICGRRPLVKFA